MTDIKSYISDLQFQLEAAYPEDEARAMAWWIVEELSGLSRTQLQFGCKDTTFLANMQEKTQEIISRLLHFEPIQYIFGHTLWNGLDLKVTPATLIPRPETAELVEEISNHKSQITNLKSPIRVLDIGTGTGCIAIALKKAHPEWQVSGIDISPEAIEVARENAIRNNVDVNFLVADIFSDEIEGISNSTISPCTFHFSSFNVVVSNPPYITESEKVSMKSNVLDYEPHTALFVPDSDPLRFYRRIAELFSLSLHTEEQGCLFFEINEAFAHEMEGLLHEKGYADVRVTRDIYGKERIIEGKIEK